jgi:tRNA G18 (ribose-2'-O)-methylase SpoU
VTAVATVVRVSDSSDPRLADFVGLTDIALRRRKEPAEGLFLAEGEKVIRRAIGAGFPVRSLLTSQRWVEPLSDVLSEIEAPVFVGDEDVLVEVTGFHVHRGALASMGRLPLPSLTDVASSANRLMVLEGVVDHTNIGAAFRSAAALGMDGAVLDSRCADPLYRRSIKVSMGAVFSLPWTRATAWPNDLHVLRDLGYTILALTPDPSAVPLDELGPAQRARCAVMLGTEGDGLSQSALRTADVQVRIPMSAGIDSLNVAAASAVAFYALGRLPA